jgi:histone acetyltransferase MYST1
MGSEMSEVEAGRLTRRRSTAVGVASEVANTVSSGAMTTSSMMVAEEHIAVDVVTTIAAPVLDEHEGMDAAALKEHEEVTKVKNVNTLELGKFRMDTWYFSPLPKELLNEGGMIDVLYVDEFSFNFFVRKEELQRFQSKTYNLSGKKASRGSTRDRRHPPGNEIYRCGNLSSE